MLQKWDYCLIKVSLCLQIFLEICSEKFKNSLSNLKTDYLDIYQLHSPSKESLSQINESFPWLIKKKEEGLIKKIGISARSPSDAIFFLKHFVLDVIQCNFNLIDQRLIETGCLIIAKKFYKNYC